MKEIIRTKHLEHTLTTLPTSLRTLVVLFAMLLSSAGAWADPSGNWSNYKATSFSVINENAKTISITSEAELALLGYNSRNTSNYEGYTITLTRSLDMSAHMWDCPIGKSPDGFKGTFDGGNHTISGVTLNKGTGYSYQGLFGYVKGTVKNLTLENSSITAQMYVGGIAGRSYGGTIQNCHVLASVSVYSNEGSSHSLGGIVGELKGTITDCTSAASVTASNTSSGGSGVGGIAGWAKGTISNCFYYGSNISGATGKYGAIGGNIDDNTISNCYYTMSNIDAVGNSYQGTYTPTITNVSRCNQLTLGENITTTTATTTFTVPAHDEMNSEGTQFEAVAAKTYSFYTTGQSIALSYSGSGTVVFAVNGESIVGNTFSMPEGGATVTLYAGGTGPEISGLIFNSTYGYYEIPDAAALNALATYVNSSNKASGLRFMQTADINMQGVNYTPIGKDTNYEFSGTYDGNGYVILNISHQASGKIDKSGMFGEIENGTIKNVNLKDCSFSGIYVGGITGHMNGGTIDNCTVIGGSVRCGTNGYSGGIAGYIYAGKVKNCFTTATTSASSAEVSRNGPIVGREGNNSPVNSYYTKSVSGGNSLGANISGGFITAGDGVTIGSGVWRTIGKTEANTYRFGKQNDAITFSAEVSTSGMKKFTATAETLAGTATVGTVSLTMPASDVTVSLADVSPTITVATGSTYTGNAVEPAVTVVDGETTLTLDTDYTVAYSNNINAGEATVSITGKDMYIGKASQTFTISPRVDNNGAITITDYGTTKTAVIDGTSNEAVSITEAIVVDAVTINRTFTANQASTVFLPFTIAKSNVTGGKFYTFTSVDETTSPWTVKYTEVGETDNLVANTPYIFMPNGDNSGKIVVSNGSDKVSLQTAAGSTTQGSWEFIGTYSPITWDANHTDLGKVYGFAAQAYAEGNVTAGQFVKAAAGASIAPGRAYLKRTVANGTRSSEAGLPDRLNVVLIGAKGGTTSLEETFSLELETSAEAEWFDLSGRRLSGKPIKKGMYIMRTAEAGQQGKKGKMVVIK